MNLKKISLVLAVAALVSACEEPPISQEVLNVERFSSEIKVSPYTFKDESLLSFNYGIYSVCLKGKAYVVGAQNAVDFKPVMDAGEHISCVEKYKTDNVTINHGDQGTGFYDICLGGYSFIFYVAGGKSLTVNQVFSNYKDGVAQMCLPRDIDVESLNNFAFIHPKLESKVKEVKKIMGDLNKNSPENQEKIY